MSDEIDPQIADSAAANTLDMVVGPRPGMAEYHVSHRFTGRIALVSTGESGIGRAVAVGLANEGADVAITYLDQHEDAQETMRLIQAVGARTMAISGDISDSAFCEDCVTQVVRTLGGIDILVNHTARRRTQSDFQHLGDAQIHRTFQHNVFAPFFLTRATLPHLKSGSVIVNTTSAAAHEGDAEHIDFAASQGAIVALTRSLALHLRRRGIRVNAVALGSSRTTPPHSEGQGTAAEPDPDDADRIARSYLFLASADAFCMAGQVLRLDGTAPSITAQEPV